MAAPRKATPAPAAPATAVFSEAWGSEPIQEFAGHDLTDKNDLVGEPFLIIGAEIERNENRDYDVVYVYALDINGTEFEFSDTSTTGVAHQVKTLLVESGVTPAAGSGFHKLRTAIMKGLRVSEFATVDTETGKKKTARTYYLSASGRVKTA